MCANSHSGPQLKDLDGQWSVLIRRGAPRLLLLVRDPAETYPVGRIGLLSALGPKYPSVHRCERLVIYLGGAAALTRTDSSAA
ncbi:hypothetical protein SBA4_440008 [Candidatus Sulfopaludibacter sp. SbA4]|nr:hypothetical protein SBA4_440008 [Candidatus Sulfopaludibacter sp. SbA4]